MNGTLELIGPLGLIAVVLAWGVRELILRSNGRNKVNPSLHDLLVSMDSSLHAIELNLDHLSSRLEDVWKRMND